MNRPRTMEVLGPSRVKTSNSPGKSPPTTAADVIAPTSCATKMTRPLIHGRAPMRQRPNVTLLFDQPSFWSKLGGQNESHRGVKDTSSNAEENPNVDKERKAKRERYVEQSYSTCSYTSRFCRGLQVGNLRSRKGKEEKHKCSNELSNECNDMFSQCGRKDVQQFQATVFADFSFRCWHIFL